MRLPDGAFPAASARARRCASETSAALRLRAWICTACGPPGVSFWRRLASISPRSSSRVTTYTIAEAITTAAATAPAASRIMRRRKLISPPPSRGLQQRSSSRGLQHVADPAHGVHESRLAAGLGLAAQVADVDLERVGGGAEVIAPHAVEDRGARQHLARMAHQQFEQQELGARELERALAAARLVRARVELEVLEAQHLLVALPAGAPQERAQPRDQLLAREGLGEV